jgi:hypothetical protein
MPRQTEVPNVPGTAISGITKKPGLLTTLDRRMSTVRILTDAKMPG